MLTAQRGEDARKLRLKEEQSLVAYTCVNDLRGVAVGCRRLAIADRVNDPLPGNQAVADALFPVWVRSGH